MGNTKRNCLTLKKIDMSNLILGNVKTKIVNVLNLTTLEYQQLIQNGSTEVKIFNKYFLEKRLVVEFETVPFEVIPKVDPHPTISGNITIEYYLSNAIPNMLVNQYKKSYIIQLDPAILTHTTTTLLFETDSFQYSEGGFFTCSAEEQDVITTTKDKVN